MTLAQALQTLHTARTGDAPVSEVSLACGFTPLHLQTFFHAHLQSKLTGRKVQMKTGLYGDLVGTVEGLPAGLDAAAVVAEWADLDPRLGFRQLGGWKPSQMAGLVAGFDGRLRQLEDAIRRAAERFPVAVAFPTLRLPPAFLPVNAKASTAALALRAMITSCAERLAGVRNTSIVNTEELDSRSPATSRYDLKADLITGFPYTAAHAEILARMLAEALSPRSPKKGLITDLDDTLWAGIVGEVGPQAVSWDLAQHSQLHGIYQQLLDSLAEQGVLLAVASKNDPAVVERIWSEREDMLAPREKIFPLEVSWGPKSEAVGQILRTWNIAADSVIFIDDSPLEAAEVQGAFPGMECVVFPKDDYPAALELFYRLRDSFGKDSIQAEDSVRMESIRHGQAFQKLGPSQEEFLAGLDALITFVVNPPLTETRVLELVNKTNQFNLNGVRYGEPEWRRLQAEPGAITLAVVYQDKFGPLGTIAVLHGKKSNGTMQIPAWVMSCRAFSRRIEFATLQFLIEHFQVKCFDFDFLPTERNGPVRSFLAEVAGGEPHGKVSLDAPTFASRCPALAHQVKINESETVAK